MASAPDPSTPAAVLGDRIRKRRLELGWSQEEFARRAKKHYTYISQVERGVTNTRIDYLADLAFILGVDVATLTRGLLPRGRRRRQRRKLPPPG